MVALPLKNVNGQNFSEQTDVRLGVIDIPPAECISADNGLFIQQGVRTMNETTLKKGSTDRSPVDAFTPALEHTRRMLFEPFDIAKWFVLGFVIFLAQLISADSGGWGGSRLQDKLSRQRHGNGPQDLQQAAQWVVDNVGWIMLIAVAAFILINLIAVIIQYLGARGHFMLLENVMENKAEVAVPWRNASRPAWSLFLWRVAVFILLFWCFVLLLALPAWGIIRVAAAGEFSFPGSLISLLPFVALYIPLAILIGLADLLVRDFVTPVMVLHRIDLLGALEKSLKLWRGHIGNLMVYLLFRLLIYIVTGALGVAVACFTCCIGVLPVIYQTITAPIHIFVRSWTLAILEGIDPELLSISKHSVKPEQTA